MTPLFLSPTQAAILRFVRSHLAQHGRALTASEVSEQIGIFSAVGVACRLRALQRKGLIRVGRDLEVAINDE